MYYGTGWDDEVVYVEEPVYYDWDCPDGYTRDDWGQCVPEVTDVFVIEREILYLYPDLVATYPDLQLHPEFLFRYRPELRTRYANVRSVSELRNRYTQVHHAAPPQRPASAPPAHGSGKAQRGTKTPGAQPSKHAQPPAHTPPTHGQPSAYGQPSAQQASTKSPAAPPAHGGPSVPPSTYGAPTQPPAQHAALTSPTSPSPHAKQPGSLSPSAPKDKTVTSGLFADAKTSHYVGGALVGAVLGLILADDDESRLKLPIAFAACGAIVSGIVNAGAGARTRVGYYVPGLFPETREWLENE